MILMNSKIGEKVRTEWKKVRLGEVAEINKYSVYKNFPHNEIEYIDISSVGTGVLLETKKHELKSAPGRAKRLIKDGNTILSTVRPNRRSFLYIKNPKDNLVVSTGFAVLNPTPNIDSRFLYYVIADQSFTDYLSNHAKGAAYPAVDAETIAKAIINFPSFSTQRKISSILSAYDDLIENNNRRIKILEEMAQAIYKEWFVNYRFPGHEKVKMVKSKLGMIPEGWEVGRLGEIVSSINDATTAGEHLCHLPYVPIDCIPRKQLGLTEFKRGNEAQSSLVLFKKNDILFGAMRSYFHKVIIAPFDGVTRKTCFVLRPVQTTDFAFAVLTLFQDSTVGFASQHSRGSTIPYAVWDRVFENMPIIKPHQKVRTIFNELVEPLLIKISTTLLSNLNLRKTRDLLLPKLISGEVEVEKNDA